MWDTISNQNNFFIQKQAFAISEDNCSVNQIHALFSDVLSKLLAFTLIPLCCEKSIKAWIASLSNDKASEEILEKWAIKNEIIVYPGSLNYQQTCMRIENLFASLPSSRAVVVVMATFGISFSISFF